MEAAISNKIYEKINYARKISTAYPNESYIISKEAYNLALKNNLKAEEGYSLISMAFSARANSEIHKMLKFSFEAFEIFESLNETLGKIKALNLIGIAYFYSSMYEDALNYLLQANGLLQTIKDDFLLSCVLNNIGEVYRESKVYDKAMEYYESSLKLCYLNDFKINSASIIGNLGEVYYLENKYTESLSFFNKSYDILIKENDMISLGEAENRLGKAHYAIGDFSKSEEYFTAALNRLEGVNNKYYAIDALVNLAKLKIESNLNQSIICYEKAMQYAESINASKKLSEVYKLISEYYEQTEDYKTAIEYYKKHSHINEEIITSNLGNKLEIMKVELEYIKESDKLDNIKRMLEKEIHLQKNELLKIKKSNEMLEKAAYEDELTKIPNRRFINGHLNKIWSNPHENDETIALFMIDIDYFKKYNDYWGHACGDQCLKRVAECFEKIKDRHRDIVGRYGGEEFIYIARNINYNEAVALGNELREEVEKLGITYMCSNMEKTITISIGGTIGKVSDFNYYSYLLEASDKELYKAKDLGRNITLVNNKLV